MLEKQSNSSNLWRKSQMPPWGIQEGRNFRDETQTELLGHNDKVCLKEWRTLDQRSSIAAVLEIMKEANTSTFWVLCLKDGPGNQPIYQELLLNISQNYAKCLLMATKCTWLNVKICTWTKYLGGVYTYSWACVNERKTKIDLKFKHVLKGLCCAIILPGRKSSMKSLMPLYFIWILNLKMSDSVHLWIIVATKQTDSHF